MKRGTSNHPKVYALCEAMNIDRPTALGYLILLWEFASEYAPEGDIGKYPDTRIEAAMDFSGRGKPRGKLIEALSSVGFVDRDDEVRLKIHDWTEHCEKYVHRRIQRRQQVSKKVTSQLSVTDPESDFSRARVALAIANSHSLTHGVTDRTTSQRFDELAERMYRRHPNKAGRVMFEQALSGALSTATDPPVLAAKIEHSHTAWLPTWETDGGKFAPRLDRWILERRFLDAPPTSPQAEDGYLDVNTPGLLEEFRRRELGQEEAIA
jgi:hypothetical protein